MANRTKGLRGVVLAMGFGLCLVGGQVGSAGAARDTAYGRMLARHVHPGTVSGIELNLVDYAALPGDPDYRQALRDFAEADPAALSTDADRWAFWANAYNLLAIKAVVDRMPIDSIKDGGNLLFPIWGKKVGTVAGREYSLDEIEHGILRKEFDDPRVHFAVVCASLSCPDLRDEPYAGARLDSQLDEQVERFLANRTKGLRPGEDGASAEVSSIFKWYGEDFEGEGGVATYLRENAGAETSARIAKLTDDGISYLDYDWTLNDAARSR